MPLLWLNERVAVFGFLLLERNLIEDERKGGLASVSFVMGCNLPFSREREGLLP